jgi:hypothetical protein
MAFRGERRLNIELSRNQPVDIRRPFGTFTTNFAGVPVTIGYIRDHTFQVELPTRPPDLRVTLIEAKGDQGERLSPGSWGQHRFSTPFARKVGQREWNVRATIAIHPNYPVQFTRQPRYERVARH